MRLPDLPRPVLFLSGGMFVLSICSFMIVPLLALYLSRQLHVPAAKIGVVLAVMAIANQGLQVLVGIVADRSGTRTVFSLGILAAATGYAGFAFAPPFGLQIVLGFTLGLGRATISLISKVLLTSEAGDQRAAALVLRNLAVNAGTAIGPVIGGLLLAEFASLLIAVVVVHSLFWLAMVRMIPVHRPAPGSRPNIRQLFGNRALLSLTAASVGFWYLYTQLTFTFPLYADDQFHLGGRVGLLFAVNAVLAVALQYAAVAWFGSRLDGWSAIALGCAGVAIAFLVLGILPSVWALLLFVVIFSIGEIVVVPMLDIVTSDLAPATARGSSFGFASLGWAVGGVLGSGLGGIGYQAFSRAGNVPRFWLINSAVGAVTAATFVIFRHRFGHREEPA